MLLLSQCAAKWRTIRPKPSDTCTTPMSASAKIHGTSRHSRNFTGSAAHDSRSTLRLIVDTGSATLKGSAVLSDAIGFDDQRSEVPWIFVRIGHQIDSTFSHDGKRPVTIRIRAAVPEATARQIEQGTWGCASDTSSTA